MKTEDHIRLVLLSAIWGASFLFMRIATPEFGFIPLALIRVSVAALVFLPLFYQRENRIEFQKNFRILIVVGFFNSTLPFSCLSYATLSLEGGFTSLLNAMTPVSTAIIGAIWFGTAFRSTQVTGLVVALIGVGILSWDQLNFKNGGSGWAIVSALSATVSYGVSANFTKRYLSRVSVGVVSGGSLCLASMMLLPLGALYWPTESPSLLAWGAALGLAVLCTSVAYLLFFRLITDAGAMIATTVTFLVPAFAILWGTVLLDEKIGVRMLAGMGTILFGTSFAIGLLKWGRRSRD
jgi:drug/metabolite transporter (DMT)-like permease